jgi:hypothetical protein
MSAAVILQDYLDSGTPSEAGANPEDSDR